MLVRCSLDLETSRDVSSAVWIHGHIAAPRYPNDIPINCTIPGLNEVAHDMSCATAGEVTHQQLATMAANHWRPPHACQACTPRTDGHNTSSVAWFNRSSPTESTRAPQTQICIAVESTIRASILNSPPAHFAWLPLTLFCSWRSRLNMWLVYWVEGIMGHCAVLIAGSPGRWKLVWTNEKSVQAIQ